MACTAVAIHGLVARISNGGSRSTVKAEARLIARHDREWYTLHEGEWFGSCSARLSTSRDCSAGYCVGSYSARPVHGFARRETARNGLVVVRRTHTNDGQRRR